MAWLRLLRVSQRISRHCADQLRAVALTPAQFDVLAHVGATEGITQQALANSLLVTKGNVCQILDRMEQDGLLVRQRVGRINRLYLTENGRNLFNRVVPAHERTLDGQFSVLSRAQQHELLTLLRTLDRRLGGAPGGPAKRGM